MKRLIYTIAVAVLLAGCTADLEEQHIGSGEGANLSDKIVNSAENSEKGEILVRFNAVAESRLAECATRSGATRTGVEGVDAVLDKVGGFNVKPIFVVTDKNRDKVHEAGLHLWYRLQFDESSDVEAVAADLAAVAEVRTVQFSERVCRVAQPAKNSAISSVAAPAVASVSVVKIPFNDTYSDLQWSLRNAGYYSKIYDAGFVTNLPSVVSGADINVTPAWELCKGDPSIVVAVMDEGVMNTHEDLVDNIWVNEAEKNGKENFDDDGNGYKDDIYGFNFALWRGEVSWSHKNDSGHGTHVAGIIAAMNDNKLGISGIAGGSGKKDGVKIQSLQIFYGTGGANISDIAAGMQYAADCGAHILQCSWGYLSKLADNKQPGSDAQFRSSCSVESDAIDYFVKNAGTKDGPIEGGLVIFAAGNDGAGLPSYPAAYKPCVAVASFSPSLRPAYYTNYGVGTDIIAPGGEATYGNGEILSTLPDEFGDVKYGGKYGMMQGTSQACPHVSGVAALGLSYAKKLGKRYTADQFRSMLLSATNDIEPYLTGEIKLETQSGNSVKVYNVKYPNYKNKLGNGYIDAYKLLLQIDGTPYTIVKCGTTSEIDLAPYFGDGVYNAALSKIEISDFDKESIGLGDCLYSAGKLNITCSKSGSATFNVTLLIGGGSLEDKTKPFPTEVTKSFVVMVKSGVAINGGWL